MIYINSQIEAGKVYQSESEIYPRLYVTDGSVLRRLKRLAVEIENGDIYVQTDLQDTSLIQKFLKKELSAKLSLAKIELQQAIETINAIEKVL